MSEAKRDERSNSPKRAPVCVHCGKPESYPKHIRYGNDLDNQVKHNFESEEVMSKPKRKPGFYWVKYGSRWVPAEYFEDSPSKWRWHIATKILLLTDRELDEIGPRIEPPASQSPKEKA